MIGAVHATGGKLVAAIVPARKQVAAELITRSPTGVAHGGGVALSPHVTPSLLGRQVICICMEVHNQPVIELHASVSFCPTAGSSM